MKRIVPKKNEGTEKPLWIESTKRKKQLAHKNKANITGWSSELTQVLVQENLIVYLQILK